MAYIFGLFTAGLFFFALHSFTQLSKIQKLTISFSTFIIILSAIIYNNKTAQQRKLISENITKFQQNKTLHCKKYKVDKQNYTLSIGTNTLIGKKGTSHFSQMIDLADCH